MAMVLNPVNSKPGPGRPCRKSKPPSIDVNSSCRVCLLSNGECGLFAMNPISKELLSQIFSVEVEEGNHWLICVPCLKAIEKAAEFKKMATNSDRQIKALLLSNKVTEVEPEEIDVEIEKQTPPTSQLKRKILNNCPVRVLGSVKRKVRSTFFFGGRGLKKVLPCTEEGCDRLFSRTEYMKRHLRMTHKRATTPTPTPVPTPEMPPSEPAPDMPQLEPEASVVRSSSPTEDSPPPSPIVLKDLRIKLVRCPDKPATLPETTQKVDENKKQERMLPCPYCDKEYTLSILSTHLITCTGQDEPLMKKIKTEPVDTAEKPQASTPVVHKCDVCKEKFQSLTQLLQHRGTHTESTTIIPNTFLAPPKRQAAIDANNSFCESHKCPECEKDFNQSWLLTRHLGVIHGIKEKGARVRDRRQSDPLPKKRRSKGKRRSVVPFSPKIVDGQWICCDITYTNRSSFNGHKSKHHPEVIEQKSFFCNICHVKIAGRKTLFEHYKTVHPGQKSVSNKCNICNKVYSEYAGVYYHKKHAHPEVFIAAEKAANNLEPPATEANHHNETSN